MNICLDAPDTLDLAQLDTSPEKILVQLRRAARARYRYIHLSNARDAKSDPAVDHQLANHVILLDRLAELAGVDDELRQRAIREGVAQAHTEA